MAVYKFGYYGGDPAVFTRGVQVSTWEKPAGRSLTCTKHMAVYSAMSTPGEAPSTVHEGEGHGHRDQTGWASLPRPGVNEALWLDRQTVEPHELSASCAAVRASSQGRVESQHPGLAGSKRWPPQEDLVTSFLEAREGSFAP